MSGNTYDFIADYNIEHNANNTINIFTLYFEGGDVEVVNPQNNIEVNGSYELQDSTLIIELYNENEEHHIMIENLTEQSNNNYQGVINEITLGTDIDSDQLALETRANQVEGAEVELVYTQD